MLIDLKQRGLLDETIVVWATEFGRTPCGQGADGRDHHNYGFSVWMAGGGIQGGIVHGATDELGLCRRERHYVTDIHATILHLLGIDSRRIEIPGAEAAGDRTWEGNSRNTGVKRDDSSERLSTMSWSGKLPPMEVERLAAAIDWTVADAVSPPPQAWFEDDDNPFEPAGEAAAQTLTHLPRRGQ